MKPNKLIMPIMLAAAITGGCNQTNKSEKQEGVVPEAIIAQAREDIRDQIADLKAESFNTLVSNSRVRDMAYGFFRRPLKAGPKTWAAHEFAYTGIVHPEVYDRELPRRRVRCDNDSTLDALLMEARSVVMEKAKTHLSQPDNLMSFYKSKKYIILDELHESLEYDNGSEKEERLRQLKQWFNELKNAIKVLDHEEFNDIYQDYLGAEETLVASTSDYGSKFGGISENIRSEYNTETDQKRRREIPEYARFRDAEEKLSSLTPDFEATLFAARRKKENPEILETYLAILEDLQSEIEAIK